MKYKIVILGEGGVVCTSFQFPNQEQGKSALTIQLVHRYFTYEYNPTIEEAFKTQVQ